MITHLMDYLIANCQSSQYPVKTRPNLILAMFDLFGRSESTSAAANIATSLKSTACVVYLHASTCTTLQNAVKTLIDGFLTEESILPNIKRRAALSPSNSDISVLVAWYASVQKASGTCGHFLFRSRFHTRLQGISLLLTIICRDFESFDVTVMQDLLYICRSMKFHSESFGKLTIRQPLYSTTAFCVCDRTC